MLSKKLNWYKVAASKEELIIKENHIALVEAGEKTLCIGDFRNTLYGFAYKCPHASGRMDAGYIDAIGNVVCPVHRYRFSLANGRNTSGEGYYLKTYPVEVRDDGVYVGIEQSSLFA